MVDVLNEIHRQHHVILQCRIIFLFSRMTLDCTQVSQIRIQAILKSLFIAATYHMFNPLIRAPIIGVHCGFHATVFHGAILPTRRLHQLLEVGLCDVGSRIWLLITNKRDCHNPTVIQCLMLTGIVACIDDEESEF